MRIALLLLPLAVLPVPAPTPAHLLVEPSYSVLDLGTLGGDMSHAAALNASGEVVGWSTTADGATRAFLHRAGAMTDLGTLPGGSASRATGIDDLRRVSGSSGINANGPQFEEVEQGFIWQDGSMRSVGALYCPCTFNTRYGSSAAHGLNILGQVIGNSETVRGGAFRHAFLWQDGEMQDIGGGPGSFSISSAYGIGPLGQVVGVLDGRAFLWRSGTSRDLGTLPDHASSSARAVNVLDQVVGESRGAGGSPSRAFLWDGGTMQDLGALPGDMSSGANGINSASRVVGWSGTDAADRRRAVTWQGGVISDLNVLIPEGSEWTLLEATGINVTGQIVGVGLHQGRTRAFLLTPPAPGGLWSGRGLTRR